MENNLNEQEIIDINEKYEQNYKQNNEIIFVETSNIIKPKKKNLFLKYIAVASSLVVIASASFGFGYGMSNNKEKNAVAQNNNIVFTGNNLAFTNAPTVFKSVSNSVVSINSKVKNNNFIGYQEGVGAGSGIIFHEDDNKIYIVTNDHVITGATSVTISIDDKTEVNANFVGTNTQSDIAVISVDKKELKNVGINYTIATFADSSVLEVGESVMAIGNAVGEGKSATSGIVSALNKTINIDGKALGVIQTDAAINPGNSGGALVNSKGQVIGVNTAKFSSLGIEGMGYSIPSNTVKTLVEDLIKNKNVVENKPYLGIQGNTITEKMQSYYNLPKGAYIAQIVSGGSAHVGGLKSGDIVVGYNGKTITSMEQLSEEITNTKVGASVKLDIYRNGNEKMTLNIVMQSIMSTKF